MLDIGLTFFTTLAIAFAELARKRPRMVARSRNCMRAGEFAEGSVAILDLVAHRRCPFDRSRRARASAWRSFVAYWQHVGRYRADVDVAVTSGHQV